MSVGGAALLATLGRHVDAAQCAQAAWQQFEGQAAPVDWAGLIDPALTQLQQQALAAAVVGEGEGGARRLGGQGVRL